MVFRQAKAGHPLLTHGWQIWASRQVQASPVLQGCGVNADETERLNRKA